MPCSRHRLGKADELIDSPACGKASQRGFRGSQLAGPDAGLRECLGGAQPGPGVRGVAGRGFLLIQQRLGGANQFHALVRVACFCAGRGDVAESLRPGTGPAEATCEGLGADGLARACQRPCQFGGNCALRCQIRDFCGRGIRLCGDLRRLIGMPGFSQLPRDAGQGTNSGRKITDPGGQG